MGLNTLLNRFQVSIGTRIGVYLISILSLVYFFESSRELNLSIEQAFYNLRTKHKPSLLSTQKTAAVKVNIEDLPLTKTSYEYPITPEVLRKVGGSLEKFGPKKIVFVFPFGTVPYRDAGFQEYLEARQAPIYADYIGVLNTVEKESELSTFPPSLRHKIVSASLAYSDSKSEVLNDFPIYSISGNHMQQTLITTVANEFLTIIFKSKLEELGTAAIRGFHQENQRAASPDAMTYARLGLNYRSIDKIRAIDFRDIDRQPQRLTGKIIVVGFDLSDYGPFKLRNDRSRESFYSNTPWSGSSERPNKESGIFYSASIALAIDNIINQDYLRPNILTLDLALMLIAVLASAFIWKYPLERVGILLGAGILTIYGMHLFSAVYLSYMPEISRTIVYCALATTVAAFVKSQRSFINSMSIKLRTKSQQELGEIHNKFLTLLSTDFRRKNQSISSELTRLISEGELDKESASLVENAASGADELSEYLEGLAKCAEIENNAPIEANFETVNIRQTTETLFNQCHPSRKQISLSLNIDSQLEVTTDANHFKSVLYNLISNAVKYSPESSTIEVCASKDPNHTTIEVMDRGPGIPAELKERIFEKFYRIKDDRAFTSKGTGIGLYLTKYFAERIGSKVWVEDREEGGSIFKLTIPDETAR